jgi:hypothetical protein
MTHDHTSDGMARWTCPLLHHGDDIELPVAGTWNVSGSYANDSFSVPRRRRPRSIVGRARDETLVVSDDPGAVLVAVLFDASGLALASSSAFGSPIHLEAPSVLGPHRWALSGDVFPETGVLPLRVTLRYHGVGRRSDRAYGLFVPTGAIVPRPEGTQRRLRFSFDLLAHGPRPGSRPATARSRSRAIRAASQSSGAA